MKICHVITELAPAGAERCVRELVCRLPRDEFQPHVVALRGGSVADEIRSAGVPVHVLDIRCRFDLPRFNRLLNIFRGQRFDIVHTHLFHAGLIGRAAARLTKVPHLLHSEHIAEKRFLPWRFWWARMTAGRCEKIICVSQGVRDHHMAKTHLPPSCYELIHNGIDTEIYRPDQQARQRIRTELKLADNQLLCLFLGRLDRQKGLNTLLKAFDSLAKTEVGPKLRLAIAGDGPLRKELNAAAARSEGRIMPLGFRNDAPALLAAADIFCMPSEWEGFGLSAAEAMACELAVIASDVPGLNEVAKHNETGILLPSGDAAALARAISELAGDKNNRIALGIAGRKRVQQKFSINNYIARHMELYRRTVAADSELDRH